MFILFLVTKDITVYSPLLNCRGGGLNSDFGEKITDFNLLTHPLPPIYDFSRIYQPLQFINTPLPQTQPPTPHHHLPNIIITNIYFNPYVCNFFLVFE